MQSPDTFTKTFAFEQKNTQKSKIVDIQIQPSLSVDLSSLISQYCPPEITDIQIYHPLSSLFVIAKEFINQKGEIPLEILEPSVILIRFQTLTARRENSDSPRSQGKLQRSEKKKKSRERTIGQALEVVKRWRDIHLLRGERKGKRLTLLEAASIIGISKKSLDDYYCQLRLGELYHFDYVANIHEKMGVLRSYNKDYRPEKGQSQKRKNDKHPKNLHILNYFDIETKSFKRYEQTQQEEELKVIAHEPSGIQEENEMGVEKEDEEGEYSEGLGKGRTNENEFFSLEEQFFHEIQLMPLEDKDPYFEMGGKYDNLNSDVESQGFLHY